MKDAYEVLYQKEADLERVRQEVESLRVAASLLTDEDNPEQIAELEAKKPPEPASLAPSELTATGTDGVSQTPRQPSFWEFLKPARR